MIMPTLYPVPSPDACQKRETYMTTSSGHDILKTRQTLVVGEKNYEYFSLKAAERFLGDISRLPFCLKLILENLLRFEDGDSVTENDIRALGARIHPHKTQTEATFHPARVLMHDLNGVPAIVDLAAMRDSVIAFGGNPELINPCCPVDLIIDHSVSVEDFGNESSFAKNLDIEFTRNKERFAFLRWAQKSFDNLRIVPPGSGICHQINMENLAQIVCVDKNDRSGSVLAYPDSLIGTDVHTSMVNALGIMGWAVGGVEAEATILDQPLFILVPEVVGVKLNGKLRKGVTSTDLALTLTQILKQKEVSDKFVEFFGPGLDFLTLTDRAAISNMAPEYGAICSMFPIDVETINYLKISDRSPEHIELVETYARAQGLWREAGTYDEKTEPVFSSIISFDLDTVEPSVSGPNSPHDRSPLTHIATKFHEDFPITKPATDNSANGAPKHGDIVIASITSCANTCSPNSMIIAGLLARKARARGLSTKPWVKTSLAPGSKVVTDYLTRTGLQTDLDAMGFRVVGYGCATCAGNSGPLFEKIMAAAKNSDLALCAVISGNQNCEGHVNPYCKATYLASPGLVVAYAIAGTMAKDISTATLGTDNEGKPVYLRDIWPTLAEIEEAMVDTVSPEMFKHRYSNIFTGTEEWRKIAFSEGKTYEWNKESAFIKMPPLFQDVPLAPQKIKDVSNARLLAFLGDNVTTDHISPTGDIRPESPAGLYLANNKVSPKDFGNYGSYRGNHEIMVRGMFDSPSFENILAGGAKGGLTKHFPSGDIINIYDAATRYETEKVPLIIIAGKEYGTGSSRDWAAKGIKLLGVRAVIAESFNRIHRSNLLSMGIMPMELKGGMTVADLDLTGEETFGIAGLSGELRPHMEVMLTINRKGGVDRYMVLCRIDTTKEVEYYRNGGLLLYMLRGLFQQST